MMKKLCTSQVKSHNHPSTARLFHFQSSNCDYLSVIIDFHIGKSIWISFNFDGSYRKRDIFGRTNKLKEVLYLSYFICLVWLIKFV